MQADDPRSLRLLHGTGMEPIRLLLIDDDAMLADALATSLADDARAHVVGRCAPDDPELSATVRRIRPDVIALEIDALGATVPATLAEAQPRAHLIVLTAGRDMVGAVAAARAGATAWVGKSESTQTLLDAVQGAVLGHARFPPDVLGGVLAALRADARRAPAERPGPLGSLTGRELEVVRCMANGNGTGRIAVELRISKETVRTHVRNILGKLGVHNRLHAVLLARSAGLLPDPPVGPVPSLPLQREP